MRSTSRFTLLLLWTGVFCFMFTAHAQVPRSTGINNPKPNLKAALDISTAPGLPQGFLMPRLGHADTATIGVVIGKDIGMMFFDTAIGDVRFWDGKKWKGGGSSGSYTPQWWTAASGIGYGMPHGVANSNRFQINIDTLQGIIYVYNNNTASIIDNQLTLAGKGGKSAYSVLSLENDHYTGFPGADPYLRQWEVRHQITSSTLLFQWGSGSSSFQYKQPFAIDTNGQVGIGTIAPSANLEVRGNTSGSIRITSGTAGSQANLDLATYDPQGFSPNARISALDDYAFSAHITFSTKQTGVNDNPLVERMRINRDGNVGIGTGTTNPTYKIHVIGNNLAVALFETLGANKIRINDNVIDALNNTGAGGADLLLNPGGNFSGGNVGIGSTTPPLATLYVTGSICYTNGIGACSDLRYKKNIHPITPALQSLTTLEGVFYHWNREQFPEKKFDSTRQVGVIAQEVEKIYPELVITDKNGFKMVDYPKLSPILLQAIKEQQQLIEAQNVEINKLKAIQKGQEEDNIHLKTQMEEIRRVMGLPVEAKR